MVTIWTLLYTLFCMCEVLLTKVVSGGQTGVDRAALDFAGQSRISRGGWCPSGRLALDGRISEEYPLLETPSAAYHQRTLWNVRDSDGTLIICCGELSGGTALTRRFARQLAKPCLIVDLVYVDLHKHAAWSMLAAWLRNNRINTLNIAGPRERENSGIYNKTLAFLLEFWQQNQ